MFSKFFWLLILFLLIATRFVGTNWGQGYFFHPDENNMAIAITRLGPDNLNPHFYAYGQFPLYLTYLTQRIFHLTNNLSNSIFILRLYSALFSVLSGIILFFLSRYFFNVKFSQFFLLFYIFHPGLIQLAHFGTTESLLILIFSVNLFLAFKLISHPRPFYFFLISLNTGIGLASKISSLIFLFPVLLASLFIFIKLPHKLLHIFLTTSCLLFALTVYFILCPYNYLIPKDFFGAMRYETDVATGAAKVFYTNQFLHSIPYLFQVKKIFPYVSGIPQFVFGIFGFFFILKSLFTSPKYRIYWFILLTSCILYFIYFGQLYTKWTRFMSPLFFLFPLAATFLISKIKSSLLGWLVLLISLLPGIYFFKLYFQPDIRQIASRWIENNLPENSVIFSEAGNVVDIPLTHKSYQLTNFDFYQLDTLPDLPSQLQEKVTQSDYLLIPSRRIFKNQNNSDFPQSQKYYRQLFSGNLGFKLIKTFAPDTDLFVNSELAEETWTVFDRPTIRIYKKL